MGTWTPGPGPTSGGDQYSGDVSAEVVSGGGGGDNLYGDGGDDTLNGDEGNDFLHSGDGNNTLNGGDGEDWLQAFGGEDVLSGGEGNDRLEEYGGALALDGGGGDDIITLGAVQGSGSIAGGIGADELIVGSNLNLSTVTISGMEILSAQASIITATAAQLESFSTIRRSSSDLISSVTLTLATAGSVDLASELLGRGAIFTGSTGDDVVTTSNGADTISGGLGSDILSGGLGSDTLHGEAGDEF